MIKTAALIAAAVCGVVETRNTTALQVSRALALAAMKAHSAWLADGHNGCLKGAWCPSTLAASRARGANQVQHSYSPGLITC